MTWHKWLTQKSWKHEKCLCPIVGSKNKKEKDCTFLRLQNNCDTPCFWYHVFFTPLRLASEFYHEVTRFRIASCFKLISGSIKRIAVHLVPLPPVQSPGIKNSNPGRLYRDIIRKIEAVYMYLVVCLKGHHISQSEVFHTDTHWKHM